MLGHAMARIPARRTTTIIISRSEKPDRDEGSSRRGEVAVTVSAKIEFEVVL
jgi:hypothetical protein